MNIMSLHINRFGKLADRDLRFQNGINLITGENESGKSTLHAFIGAMLLGPEKVSENGQASDSHDSIEKYRPWEEGTFGGVLELENDGKRYSVSRYFDREVRSCLLTNETDAVDIHEADTTMEKLTHGMTGPLFRNTLSVAQLSAGTGKELANELRAHIVNLQTTGTATLSTTKAISGLMTQRRYLMASYSKDAREEAKELTLRIDSMEQDLANEVPQSHLSRLENDKNAQERKLLRMEKARAQLESELAEKERLLKEHQISSPQDVDQLRGTTNSLAEEYRAYSEKHRHPILGWRKALNLLFLTLLIAVVLFCGYAVWIGYIRNAFAESYPFMGAGVLAMILIIILTARLLRAKDHKQVCEDLSDLYADYVGEPPKYILPEHIDRILCELGNYLDRFGEIDTIQQELQAQAKSIDYCRQELDVLTAGLEASQQESRILEQKEEALWALQSRMEMLEPALSHNAYIEEEAAAIDLAIRTMQALSAEVYDSFGHFLQETSSQLIRSITDGFYSGIFIDDDFSIFLEQDDRRIPLGRVSGGTIDQVYLAVRLACIEFLWPDEAMPLFLDETFALYDDNRLSVTLKWLSENYPGQIFLFTCHGREASILNNQNLPFRQIQL